MYDYLFTRATEFPSSTIQWLPTSEKYDANGDVLVAIPDHIELGVRPQKLLMGTQTQGTDSNFIYIASLYLPGYPDIKRQNDLEHMRPDEFGSFTSMNGMVL